ncbi:MAG: hypothetical protein LQ344_006846 [Seirophora lacunosa]|nr:MAG: hypothetical protein LQ344_006846 [Seirophora lacunosa]
MGLDKGPIELFEEIEALKQRTDSSLKSLFATWDTDENSLYMDEMHRLINGHSLALALLTLNMLTLGPEASLKRFMLAVLQGAPVILNYKALIHKSDEAIEGLRSLQGVDRMISDLRTKLPFLFKHLE